jgi:DHA1 family multidrug resistance protein-like MFS transporter
MEGLTNNTYSECCNSEIYTWPCRHNGYHRLNLLQASACFVYNSDIISVSIIAASRMWNIIRDAALGQCLRVLTRRRLAKYPEEDEKFQLPAAYSINPRLRGDTTPSSEVTVEAAREIDDRTMPASGPSHLNNGIITVTWCSNDDPENPHNWSLGKKLWVAILLFVYTFTVYIGSSLYTAGEMEVVRIFGVSEVAASLGLSLYVIGYGIGPLIFSPLSEVPAVGRNPIYIITFFFFAVLCVPMVMVNSFSGILVLRLLLGFFGSPCLATAGASYGDFYSPAQMPYVIAMWGGGATLGPAFGPLVGGFAVQAMGWRWSSWELLWLSVPTMMLMFLSMPETSADKILLKRAQRLRALTGRTDLISEGEMRQAGMNAKEIAIDALIKPWQINALDPAVLFSTFYTALTYGIYYSFFECFPLVFNDIYNFNLGELGLAFLAVLVGLAVAVTLLCAYLYLVAPRRLAKLDPVPPEARIWPGLFATFLIPIGLYIFGESSALSIVLKLYSYLLD